MAIVRWRPFGQAERWDPFRELGDVQAEMNRVFDSFFGRAHETGGPRAWVPVVDVYETKDDLVVTAELPGVTDKDVQLSITAEVLTLRGERVMVQEVKPESFYRAERWFGKFERSVALPIPVQAGKVKATYRDGVLKITLPKAEEVRPKDIKIDVL
jgi:HSP20 family protein